jgi:hypothetical protein
MARLFGIVGALPESHECTKIPASAAHAIPASRCWTKLGAHAGTSAAGTARASSTASGAQDEDPVCHSTSVEGDGACAEMGGARDCRWGGSGHREPAGRSFSLCIRGRAERATGSVAHRPLAASARACRNGWRHRLFERLWSQDEREPLRLAQEDGKHGVHSVRRG